MGGKKTNLLERKISKIFGMKYGLMTNSGSSSNLLALKSFNFDSGEIITPALTFSTTVAPIVQCGLIPVFVDVDIKTLQIDTNLIQNAINKKTVAIMVPNLIGNIADWKELRKIADNYKLALIEDSCDTVGYKYKSGQKYSNAGPGQGGGYSTFGEAHQHGDILRVAVDIDAGKIWFARNEIWQAGGDRTCQRLPHPLCPPQPY